MLGPPTPNGPPAPPSGVLSSLRLPSPNYCGVLAVAFNNI